MGLYGNEKNYGQRKRFYPRREKNWHSRMYHRYFEGYAEVKEVGKNGKEHIKRIYVSEYYCPKLSRKMRMLLKMVHIMFFAMALYLFVCGAVATVESNSVKVIIVFEAAVTIGFVALLVAVIDYLLAPGKMKIFEFKASSESIKTASVLTAVGSALCFTAKLIYAFFQQGTATYKEIQSISCLMLSAIFLLIMYGVERKIQYEKVENTEAAPEDSMLM